MGRREGAERAIAFRPCPGLGRAPFFAGAIADRFLQTPAGSDRVSIPEANMEIPADSTECIFRRPSCNPGSAVVNFLKGASP